MGDADDTVETPTSEEGEPVAAADEGDGAEEPMSGGDRRLVIGVAIAVILVVAGVIVAVALQGGDDEDDVATDQALPEDDEPVTETDEGDGTRDDDDPAEPLDDGTEPDEEVVEEDEPMGEPVEVATGSLMSLDYEVSGTVRVIEQVDGSHIVRLEDLASDDGPDLYVYLSGNPADGPGDAFKDDYVDLGSLRDTQGTQDYEVPGDVDPLAFASLVIWCEAVSAPFGAADL